MQDDANTLAVQLAVAARQASREDDAIREAVLPGRRALLVDRHPLWHEAVELVLRRLEVAVAGRFVDADSAMAALEEDSADLLVVDVDVGGSSDGSGLVRLARTRRPTIRIVVLTLDDSPARVHSALIAGADAYVLKAAHPDDLAAAVRQSFTHSMYLAAPPAGLSHETTPLTAR